MKIMLPLRKTLLLFFILKPLGAKKYTPDWSSLDSRPLPEWYDKAKVGIFMHFGPYAVPGINSEWFWMEWKRKDKNVENYMKRYYPSKFTYQDFGPMLWMEFFNATQFAEIVKSSGAKYFVFTSKHHDGFANFNSDYTFGWNSLDIGPKRDVVGELKKAFDQIGGVHFGLYYSLFEWFHPLYLADKASNFTTRNYILQKMQPELKNLIKTYQPEVLWSDGDWEAYPEYFGSQEFLAWLFNESPTKKTIVTNDRWGKGTSQKHGSFYSGPDRNNPGVLQKHKFENAMTVDKLAWGYRRNINCNDVFTASQLIHTLVETVSCGGNILINVGPTKEGTIIPLFQERLSTLGKWLDVNKNAVYESVPWTFQNETTKEEKIPVWYTWRPDLRTVYGFLYQWPTIEPSIITITAPKVSHHTIISLPCLGKDEPPLHYDKVRNDVRIFLPSYVKVKAKCIDKSGVDTDFAIAFENLMSPPIPSLSIL